MPLILGKRKGDVFEYKALAGTAFLIGRRGFAITAAHVVDQIAECGDEVVAGTIRDQRWALVDVLRFEKHPVEDVALAHFASVPHPSWLVISDRSEHQTCEYDTWGYPISVAELPARYEEGGVEHPDLIYTRGYVRRRLSKSLPISIYRGSSFYEISELAGNGCSGAPVIARKSLGRAAWQVFGVYVGESAAGFSAAYAVRTDAFHAWKPEALDRTIREESLDHWQVVRRGV